MKNGKTLTQLAMEIERQEATKRDLIVPANGIQFGQLDADTTAISVEGDVLPLTEVAENQLATKLQIPSRYFQKLKKEQPALLEANVNTLIRQESPTDLRMIRTLDGNARAYLSNKYARIDNAPLLEALLPLAHGYGLTAESMEVTDRNLHLKYLTPKMQGEVRVGDVLRAGIGIKNSEIGMGVVELYLFLYRLWCTNGSCHIENVGGFRRYHIGNVITVKGELRNVETQPAVIQRLTKAVNELMTGQGFQMILDTMRKAADRVITAKPEDAVLALSRVLIIPANERPIILRHFLETRDFTQYGLFNAVTRTAEDVKSYDRATELESLGDKVLNLRPNQWKIVSTSEPENAAKRILEAAEASAATLALR